MIQRESGGSCARYVIELGNRLCQVSKCYRRVIFLMTHAVLALRRNALFYERISQVAITSFVTNSGLRRLASFLRQSDFHQVVHAET